MLLHKKKLFCIIAFFELRDCCFSSVIRFHFMLVSSNWDCLLLSCHGTFSSIKLYFHLSLMVAWPENRWQIWFYDAIHFWRNFTTSINNITYAVKTLYWLSDWFQVQPITAPIRWWVELFGQRREPLRASLLRDEVRSAVTWMTTTRHP